MKITRFLVASLFLFATALATPALISAQGQSNKNTSLTVPVAGTGGGSTFAGTFQLQKFAADSTGQLVATGLLSGVVTSATGTMTSVLRTVSIPAAVGSSSTCQILHLDLGPLSLNLLGLQVNLSEIVLDITAQPGAGNLLGNLLCSVTNLLNNPSGLVNLLNQILAAL
jgi:hypothetical protein